jgi:hypothetical protein
MCVCCSSTITTTTTTTTTTTSTSSRCPGCGRLWHSQWCCSRVVTAVCDGYWSLCAPGACRQCSSECKHTANQAAVYICRVQPEAQAVVGTAHEA